MKIMVNTCIISMTMNITIQIMQWKKMWKIKQNLRYIQTSVAQVQSYNNQVRSITRSSHNKSYN